MSASIRVAVVTPTWGDPWREEDLIVERVAAALACAARVDVLVAGGGDRPEEISGGVVVRRFATTRIARSRGRSIVCAHLGRDETGDFGGCRCLDGVAARIGERVPMLLQRELARADGSDSPGLYEHLRNASYDAVVFAGLRSASTVFGVETVPQTTRVAILALARRAPALGLSVYDRVLERAERVLAITAAERDRLARRGVEAARLREIGFALRVHELAASSEPVVPSDEGLLAVVSDWSRGTLQRRLRRLAIELRARHPDVRICLLGRDAERFAEAGGTVVRHALSSIDIWRWTSRAIALLEPEADRLLAAPALEAMMYGTPVIARADSGAAREHAERGDGGIWYRTTAELDAAISWLRQPEQRAQLGEQARRWALDTYGDVDAFIGRVVEGVLGTAALEAAPAIR